MYKLFGDCQNVKSADAPMTIACAALRGLDFERVMSSNVVVNGGPVLIADMAKNWRP